jgi:hypothetical protein
VEWNFYQTIDINLWVQYPFTGSTRENNRARLDSSHIIFWQKRNFRIAKHRRLQSTLSPKIEPAADQQESTQIQIKELFCILQFHRSIVSVGIY